MKDMCLLKALSQTPFMCVKHFGKTRMHLNAIYFETLPLQKFVQINDMYISVIFTHKVNLKKASVENEKINNRKLPTVYARLSVIQSNVTVRHVQLWKECFSLLSL